MPTADLFPMLIPLSLVLIGALVALGFEPFLQRASKHAIIPWLAAGFLVAAGLAQAAATTGHVHGLLAMDTPRMWLCVAIIVAAICSIAGLQQSLSRDDYPGGEAYALTMLATVGAMVMTMANDSLALFVGIELASLSIYAMVGLRRSRAESNEALFKYFIMGSVFSAIYLYGTALTYGATGSTGFGHAALDVNHQALFHFGQVLMLIGLLFKVGVVPFHFWAPDAYTGAPIAVTGFMGAVIKVGGFTAIGSLWLNLVAISSGTHPGGVLNLGEAVTVTSDGMMALEKINLALLVLGLLSLVLGNFSALKQTSARRIVAYSSIAHGGYMMLALALPTSFGEQISLNSLWYYLVAYAIATAGALAAFAAISGKDDAGDNLSNLAGQGRAQPFYGLMLTIFLISIAGIPPTIGFLGKFLVFADLVHKGKLMIAVFAMVMAVVGAAYYIRMIVTLWAATNKEPQTASSPVLARWALSAAAIAVFALMAWPNALGKSSVASAAAPVADSAVTPAAIPAIVPATAPLPR
jgi:NADH-quinone oxidoreductase subunit N